jgi:hypothetical protein
MKIKLSIILIAATSSLCCMDNNAFDLKTNKIPSSEQEFLNYDDFYALINNDALVLRKLVNDEQIKGFSPDLKKAEKTVRNVRESITKAILPGCNEKTEAFVRTIMERKEASTNLFKALADKDIDLFKRDITKNRFVVSRYSKNPTCPSTYITLLHFVLIKADIHKDFSQRSCRFLRVLLEHGANPNTLDSDGNTPIYYIITPDHFRILLEYGANTKIYNRKCETPLLHHIRLNHSEIAKQLIKYDGYINEIDNEGNSPLHAAVMQGMPEIATLLLQKGVSYYTLNQRHQTAVDMALEKPAMKTVFETFLQCQLCNALKSNLSEKVITLITGNPWMSLKVNGDPILKWAKDYYPQSRQSVDAMEDLLKDPDYEWVKL